MNKRSWFPGLAAIVLNLFAAFAASVIFPASAGAIQPPNVILILADDLGYGDLGCYGQQKIHTPRLDQLATEGMRFTRHYAGNAVCAPSRCVLMTGLHPGHAFIRDNREIKPEGQFPIPENTVTLAKLFKQRGYATGAFGKWGLGGPGTSGEPLRQGFDRFFGYNCQRVAHNYYPTYLWDDAKRIPLNNPDFSAHQKFPADANPAEAKNYDRYRGNDYAPDLIMQQARQFVTDHKAEPFFLYVPTTVPHLALQVPADSVAEYLGKWPDAPYDGSRGYLPNFSPHATYAAMVTRLDAEVGRLLDLVKQMGLADNTIVIFTSDNGPLYDQLGGTDTDFFRSAGDLRGLKGSLYEGGYREPMIIRWPGHIAAGAVSDRVTGFEDWIPTLLELTGHAESIPPAIDGVSFAATLRGQPQPERPFLYREFAGYGGQQSVRVGDWVAIRQKLNPTKANPNPVVKTELYHLSDDPAEQHDIAAANPDLLDRLEGLMRDQHTPSKDFPIKSLDVR